MTLRLVTAASSPLLSAEELRLYCGLQGVSDWDSLLSGLLSAAVGQIEAATQRCLLEQEYEWALPAWPARRFFLPIAPVAAGGVTQVAYVDVNGAAQTLATSKYLVGPFGPTVELRPLSTETWPLLDPDAAEPVVISFAAGQPSGEVDGNIKTAAGLLVAHLFDHRDRSSPEAATASGLPQAVEALIGGARWC